MPKRRGRGEGSIYQEKSGLWAGQITLPNGIRKKKRSKKKSVVRDWLLEQRNAIHENRIVINDNVTFEDFSDRFISDVATHTLKPKTIETYVWLLNKHIKPEIGNQKLSELEPQHLQALYSAKLDSGLSPKTVKHIHALIRRIMNEAVKWELIYRNPCQAVTPPRSEAGTPKTFTEDQAKRFLLAVTDHLYYPIYTLALGVGLRRSEILGLHWEDVDLDKGKLSIKHIVSEISGKAVLGTPKTKASQRTVDLPAFVVSSLKDHQEKTGDTRGLVFKTSKGTVVIPRNLLRHFYSVLDNCDVPRIRFHDLRHTAATLLLKENVHPKVVQEILGHTSITTTLDTYSHVVPTMQREAVDKMDEMFSGA